MRSLTSHSVIIGTRFLIDIATMADSYVCSTAKLKCCFGNQVVQLMVYPNRTVFLTGQPMANVSDHISMYNIPSFGNCHTTSYPPTGSATAANHGTLTPMPCVPGTVSEWLNGKNDYLVKGKPALLKSSICRCQYGGVITIVSDGQTDTGPGDNSRIARETEENLKRVIDSASKTKFAEVVKKYTGENFSRKELLSKGICKNDEEVEIFIKALRAERKNFAYRFYVSHGETDEKKIMSHINGIDLDKPVKVRVASPGNRFQRFEGPNDILQGSYFGFPRRENEPINVPRNYGAQPVIDKGNGNVVRKRKVIYEVDDAAPEFEYLESTAADTMAPLNNKWDSLKLDCANWKKTKGGAIQAYIPCEFLKYLNVL